jgi:hypothetical protein
VPIEGRATKSKGIQGSSQQLSVVNGTPRITHSIHDAHRVLVVVGVLSHSDEHTSQTAGVSMTAPNTVPLLRSLTVKHLFVSLFALLKSAHTSVDS